VRGRTWDSERYLVSPMVVRATLTMVLESPPTAMMARYPPRRRLSQTGSRYLKQRKRKRRTHEPRTGKK